MSHIGNFLKLMFSPIGKIGRLQYFLGILGILLNALFVIILVSIIEGTIDYVTKSPVSLPDSSGFTPGGLYVCRFLTIMSFYSYLVLAIKRLRDIEFYQVFLVGFLIPFINIFFMGVACLHPGGAQMNLQKKSRDFSAFAVIAGAWQLTKGAKWALWAPALACMFGSLILVVACAAVFAPIAIYFPKNTFVLVVLIIFGVIIAFSAMYVSLGLLCGTLKVAIDRARGKLISGTTGFHSFSRAFPFLLTLLCFIPFIAPQLLLLLIMDAKESPHLVQIIQTIYGLLIAPLFFMALPMVVDKIDSPFTAIRRSLTIGWRQWFKLVIVLFVIQLISLLSMLPFQVSIALKNYEIAFVGGIFLLIINIWLVPFVWLLQGVTYHKLID